MPRDLIAQGPKVPSAEPVASSCDHRADAAAFGRGGSDHQALALLRQGSLQLSDDDARLHRHR